MRAPWVGVVAAALSLALIAAASANVARVYASASKSPPPIIKKQPLTPARYCGLMFKSDGSFNPITGECVIDATTHGVSAIVIVPCPDGAQVPIVFAVQADGSVSYPPPLVACANHLRSTPDGGAK